MNSRKNLEKLKIFYSPVAYSIRLYWRNFFLFEVKYDVDLKINMYLYTAITTGMALFIANKNPVKAIIPMQTHSDANVGLENLRMNYKFKTLKFTY